MARLDVLPFVIKLLLAVLLILAVAPTALAQDLRLVSQSGAGLVQARVGEEVWVRVEMRQGRRWGALPPETEVRWLRIEPHMQHANTPPPNAGIQQYSNSVLFGPEHGRWIGYDRVEYHETPLSGSERERVLVRAHETQNAGAGTLWLGAEATLPDGRILRTSGAESVDRFGMSTDVFRVSFRTNDSLLGWLSTYFGVPNIFGSTAPQADRYVGADCADVLVGAIRAGGNRRVRYASVSGIRTFARPVTEALRLTESGQVVNDDGTSVTLRWTEDVLPGDFVVIDYIRAGAQMPRSWDHVGAIVGDTDRDGVLGGGDLLRHMTPRGLLDRAIGREGPIRIRLYRSR